MSIIYIFIGAVIYWGAYTKQVKFTYSLGIFLLFFITAFRFPSLGGTDALIYQNFFQRVPAISNIFSFRSPYMLGYVLLNSIVKTFTNNYLAYQFIYSLISITLLNVVIKNLDFSHREKCIYLFTYFCFRFIWINWVELRQNIADLVIWLTLIHAFQVDKHNEKVKIGVFGIIISSLFHSSALINIIVFPLMLFLEKIPLNKKRNIVVFLSIVLYFFSKPVYTLLSNIIAIYVDSRYTMYLSNSPGDGNFINFLLIIVSFLMFCKIYKSIEYKSQVAILNSLAVMVLIGSINAEVISRVTEYYSIGLYAAMTLSYKNFTKTSSIIVTPVYWCGLMLILYRFLIITDNGLYMNYRFYW